MTASDSTIERAYKKDTSYTKLSSDKKKLYDSLFCYMERYAKVAEGMCGSRKMHEFETISRDSIISCTAIILERFKRNTQESRFQQLMKKYKVKECDFDFADQTLTSIIQDVMP